VQIFLAFLHKETVQLSGSALFGFVLTLGHRSDQFHEFCLFFTAEQVGHFVSIEQIVDIFDKRLILDFAVSEKEDSRLVLATTLLQDPLEILLPFQLAVSFRDFNLENLVFADLRGQPGQALPARAAHSDEAGVACGLLDDATDDEKVLHCEREQDQVHRLVSGVVVVHQGLLHCLLES
jgi:hypothetical protein